MCGYKLSLDRAHGIYCFSALLSLNSTRAAKIPAQVPEPKIWEALNQSANLSCNSNGPPLSLCMWSHRVEDRLEVTLLNRHGWYISTDGIRLSSEGDLNDGKCSVSIRSVTKDNLGLWTCALVVVGADQVLSGQVELQSGKKCGVLIRGSNCWSAFSSPLEAFIAKHYFLFFFIYWFS